MDITELLTKFGLSKNEALVYMALIKLTEASAYALAKETKIPKTSTYEVLESLKSKGFVLKSIVNGSSYFTPESPSLFLTSANDKIDIAKMIIPALQNITQTDHNKPSVKFYTGEEGVKKAFEDVLITLKKTNIRIKYTVADPKLTMLIPRYFIEWQKKREKFGIHTKLLTNYSDTDNNTESKLLKNNDFRETRIIPKEYIFSTSIDVYANKVAIFSYKKDSSPHAIIIESESVAETLKKFFEFMWKFAEIPK
jgi:HTH-type transcriptional regulator, sugar sensing transcriptional regulator